MGTETTQLAPTKLADTLFTPVQQRVLGLLFGQPDREFQSAELIELVGAGTGATHRLLRRMADSGLASVRMVGRQKFYRANADSPIYTELVGLVRKTIGLVGPLRDALEPLRDSISCAFVFGSIPKGTDRASSDIDLMLIGEMLDYHVAFEALAGAEVVLSRPVNPTILTPLEWRARRERDDSFASRVFDGPRILVLGSYDAIGETQELGETG